MRQVILASQSLARREIFSSLGIPFVVIPADIDEKGIRDTDLSLRAVTIATTKAEKIAKHHPDSVIIAADTFSESEGKVFEKPASIVEAKKMIVDLSGKDAVNYTGLCYIDRQNNIDFSTTVITHYSMRVLYKKEIEYYVNNFPVTQWAAGFALVLPYVATLISKVNGSYTGLAYGLPTEILVPLLKKSGFEPNPVK